MRKLVIYSVSHEKTVVCEKARISWSTTHVVPKSSRPHTLERSTQGEQNGPLADNEINRKDPSAALTTTVEGI